MMPTMTYQMREPQFFTDLAGTIPAKPGEPVALALFDTGELLGVQRYEQSNLARRPTLSEDGRAVCLNVGPAGMGLACVIPRKCSGEEIESLEKAAARLFR